MFVASLFCVSMFSSFIYFLHSCSCLVENKYKAHMRIQFSHNKKEQNKWKRSEDRKPCLLFCMDGSLLVALVIS